MNTLRGISVGAGYFSQFHFDAWNRLDEVELVAVCDRDPAVAERAASSHGIRHHGSDLDQLLDELQPDFVDIITRPDSHLALTLKAVDRGIPVICQKPLAPTFEEAAQLISAAEQAGVPFMVHENFRFQPWYREITKLLSDGVIGNRLHSVFFQCRTGDGWQQDAYLARQPYFRTMPRFLIFETGVHFIDTFRCLAGEIDGVYADLRTLNRDIAGEDSGTVLFEFASGARGLWDANRFNEPNCEDPRYTFGSALIEGNHGAIRLYDDGRLTIQKLGRPEAAHAYAHRKLNFAGDCVLSTQRHFVDCLRTGQPFETSGVDYLQTLAVQEAIYQSAASGQPIRGLASREVPQ